MTRRPIQLENLSPLHTALIYKALNHICLKQQQQ